jgi:hypothetical protein
VDAVLAVHSVGAFPAEPYPGHILVPWLLRLGCGHEHRVPLANITARGTAPLCSTCRAGTAEHAAARLGWEVVEYINSNRVRIRHLACGGERETTLGNLRNAEERLRCGTCLRREAPEHAARLGWVLVEYINAKRVIVRHPVCGTVKQVTLSQIRSAERLLCATCRVTVCLEDGCDRTVSSFGRCDKHYRRQRKAEALHAIGEVR